MYAVVGCGECEALWVVDGRPETSECPRCGHRREHAMRTKFYTAEDADAAREARARLLAERQGAEEAFADTDPFADLETTDAAVDDETYLSGAGIDPDEVAEAGERATATGEGRSRTETVRRALADLAEPSAADVREYCRERGIDPERAEEALEALRRAGDVTEQDGTYRLL